MANRRYYPARDDYYPTEHTVRIGCRRRYLAITAQYIKFYRPSFLFITHTSVGEDMPKWVWKIDHFVVLIQVWRFRLTIGTINRDL